ncbi:DUF1501 domain-containing protein [Nocardioides sp.]|uniref:DUF1501 domain-containing protein n=1 Tax=Nocardioides sp. TaxID=35761 RepID=UPI00262ED9AF|nr:DUF1501 domain-containing protein [Nocardioides sp.]
MPVPAPRTALSRRTFLGGAAAVGGTSILLGTTVVTVTGAPAAGATALGANVLVTLSLRGACDGLSLVVPHTDPAYYAARPTIGVPRTALLAADDTYGLHPQLAPLLPLWQAGRIAAIHGTGMAIPNRSHFAAMEVVENAAPGSDLRSGWLNRLIGTDALTSPLEGIAVGGSPPTSLGGTEPYLALADLDTGIAGNDPAEDRSIGRVGSLSTVWATDRSPMGAAWRTTLDADAALAPARRAADRTSLYPAGQLGEALAMVARTIRGRVGAQVITVDHGGWDMHTALGTPTHGPMVTQAGQLAKAVATFFTDLGAAADTVTLVVLSEFGRRVQENASGGLDHGWGNVMWVLGAGVRGGYYGSVAPLANTLDADVAVTLDYRSVLAEVVRRRTSASTARVFPGFVPETVGFMR